MATNVMKNRGGSLEIEDKTVSLFQKSYAAVSTILDIKNLFALVEDYIVDNLFKVLLNKIFKHMNAWGKIIPFPSLESITNVEQEW